ncbi:MAG TPA: phosphate ABC transporter substrate-binding protein PstS [Burkholderiales bacterium]|nr:phosphate ABC transporter substrate-binding protein PstS [Burkholderiales bacterium]
MRAKQISTFILLASSAIISASVFAVEITGAGATFPYPIYAKWAEAYHSRTGNELNYQSIGSGGGIKQIQNKTVDFGASDMPLKPEILEKNGLMQFPTVVGGAVPVVNIKGIKPGEIRLSGPVLADIYLGKIKKWNDPAIAALNSNVNLPDQDITVVHRSDGSGTTFIWSNYLSKVSPEWKDKVGEGTSIAWPTGVGGKGNEGVASYVLRLNGSIGYVEYAYALQNKMSYCLVKNRDGNFVAPSIDTFKAAAAGADWSQAPGMYLILTDQPGANAWPISGATFILVYKTQDKPARAKEVLKFFSWAYANGDGLAAQLDYVPLPNNVVALIQSHWKNQIKDASGNPVWP